MIQVVSNDVAQLNLQEAGPGERALNHEATKCKCLRIKPDSRLVKYLEVGFHCQAGPTLKPEGTSFAL